MNFLDMRIEIDGDAGFSRRSRARTFAATSVGVELPRGVQDAARQPAASSTTAIWPTGRNVAIVDQTFVRTMLNGQDAIGRHVAREPRGRQGAGAVD